MDEMDLAGRALEAAPWRQEEYDRARAVLRGAMTESAAPQEAAPASTVTPFANRRFALGTRGKVGVGIGAGIAAVAAGVAVMLAGTSAPPPAAPAGALSHAPAAGSKPSSKLMSLAAFIVAGDSSLPGDASLIIRDQPTPAGPVEITYNLYADSGAYYAVDAQGEGAKYAAQARRALTAAVNKTRTSPTAGPARWRPRATPRPGTSPPPASG